MASAWEMDEIIAGHSRVMELPPHSFVTLSGQV
jgi:hypothetical protein